MGPILKIALLAIAVWLVLRSIKRSAAEHPSAPPTPALPVDMLRCDYCGVYIPRKEAITAHARIYCTREHADAVRSNK